MRQPAINGGFDEIGCKEGKRDCHVNLSRAAVFALGDVSRACCWIGDKFIKRIYTPAEIAYVERKANKFERYAARFAAKEAGMKAIGTGWRLEEYEREGAGYAVRLRLAD